MVASHTETRRALHTLRALALSLVLFCYTSLGPQRFVLPFLACVQGVILLMLCCWWGWKVLRRRGLPRSPVALPLIAAVGAAALSALFSINPRLSVSGVLETLALVLLFFVICDLLLAGWSASTFIDSILLLGATLIGQGLLITVGRYWSLWQMRVPEYPAFLLPFRLYGVADHPNLLAGLINLVLPFAIVRLAQSRGPRERLAYGSWLAGADVVLFFTRSRGGWVAASVVITITVGWLLFLQRPPRWADVTGWVRSTWRIWLAAAAYLALFAALFVLDASLSQSQHSTSGGSVSSLAGRPLFWRIAWDSFLARPLTGTGPLTYPYMYVSSVDRTRYWVGTHAHNLILTELGEKGIAGLLALGWVAAAAALALARAWRSASKVATRGWDERRSVILPVCASLLGSLVHSLVDTPFWLPTNAMLAVMLVAVGLQAAGSLQQGKRTPSRWGVAAFAVPLLLVYVLGRQNAAQAASIQGISRARNGDWRAAAQALDSAVSADPAFSFYQAQRGFAYGVLADPLAEVDDQAALGRAQNSYRVVLEGGPEHVPDLLNASWLQEQAGSIEQAESTLEAAVRAGADWALPALLLGDGYAAQGRAVEAQALFETAFEREPEAREMAGCLRSPACREATQRIPAKSSAVSEAHERARDLLAQGRPQDALAALQEIPLTDGHPLPWLDRADAHVMLGELAQARYALRVAAVLGADRYAESALSRASYCLAEGQTDQAIAALERVARPQVDDVPYSLGVFRLYGLPGSLLPSLAMLQRTPVDLAVYRELAQLYANEGRAEEAAWAERQAATLAGLLGGPAGAG